MDTPDTPIYLEIYGWTPEELAASLRLWATNNPLGLVQSKELVALLDAVEVAGYRIRPASEQ